MLKLAALLAFVVGICLLQTQATLPPVWPWLLAAAFCTALPLMQRSRPRLRWLFIIAAFVLGFGYADWRAGLRMADRLDPAQENIPLDVSGYIADLPQPTRFGTRFTFVPDAGQGLPERIQTNWYGNRRSTAPDDRPALHAGQRWQLQLKAKQPHGSLNPGGFDLESWLMQQGVGATASVKSGELLAGFAWQAGISRIREALRARIVAALPDVPYRGVIVALTVGDQGGLPPEQWQRYANTGVTHLISISGLHITLLAGLMATLTRWLWRRSPRLCSRIGAPRAALTAGVVTALVYSTLAGMSVPTQRTLIMLAIAAYGMWRLRPSGPLTVWLSALAVVVAFDPFSVLSVGFWLSFLTVGGLLWASSAKLGEGLKWQGWIATQWAATLASFPVLLIVFQQVPLVSPLANAVAIPVVSLLVTPLALFGLIEPFDFALYGAERLFALTDWFLQWCERLPTGLVALPAPPAWAGLPAALGVLLWLAPRGTSTRLLGTVFLLPLVAFKPVQPADVTYRATVLDVGQGLSVLVQTGHHALLYDTGTPSAGQRNILPALRALGVKQLDAVVVSHNDNDHSGGAVDVLKGVPSTQLLSTLPDDHPARQLGVAHVDCEAGQSWQRDGVNFDVLWPPADLEGDDNAHSCVLQVSAPDRPPLLLTGDIGKREEAALADTGTILPHGILVAPHHGSASSSSPALLGAAEPKWVVFSAGYLNHYRHPNRSVLNRYAAAGAEGLRTDHDGAISFSVGDTVAITTERNKRRRYWLAAPPVTDSP
ncbi:DNA internalization-related competence protein ComEC/Rec2 [Andreprevotia chitinilytica]|uniref:DNA internalization-related competence protein ComEC/Rec2 n=1 Tax=Andreprevotia chitinilytica TaxID=396808 RepID=UPI0005530A28|nr:DNA internalization-related competence protein ComEC/Rec2 [Andreprevotia chitinilytica]